MASESTPETFGRARPSTWPGERLGLPKTGPRSVARVGRRLMAIAVDWAIASGISAALLGYAPWATLGIFAIMHLIFTPTLGGSIGHRTAGLTVVNLHGGWVGVWRPAIRTLLLVIVLPALVWDSDQRGFHDVVARTVLIRSARTRGAPRR